MNRTLQNTLHEFLEGGWSPGVRKWYAMASGLLLFLFPFSLVFVVGGMLPARFAWTASVVISVNALSTVLSEMRHATVGRVVRHFLLLSFALFCVEYAGITWGHPFGSYRYTEVLGLSLLGVPLVIPLAWYTTTVNTWRVAQGILKSGAVPRVWRVMVSAGLLTVALDLVLEPMASMIHAYWLWTDGAVPAQNYTSWFLFSMLAVVWLYRQDTQTAPRVPGNFLNGVFVLGMQWTLFAVTDLVHGQTIPVLVSALLVALVWSTRNIRFATTFTQGISGQ